MKTLTEYQGDFFKTPGLLHIIRFVSHKVGYDTNSVHLGAHNSTKYFLYC